MRCLSCEPLLDAYLEATLGRRQMHDVALHLRRCRTCESLLDELRIIDALLATTRPPRVGSDFTAAVVSATRAEHLRSGKRIALWIPLLAYLAAAWALVAAAAFRGPELARTFAGLAAQGRADVTAIEAASRALGPATGVAAATVTGVLLLDLVLLAATFYAYRRLRPMLAVYLARGPRS